MSTTAASGGNAPVTNNRQPVAGAAALEAIVQAPRVTPREWRRDSAKAQYARLAALLGLTDALCIIISLVVAFLLRYGFRDLFASYAVTVVLAPVVWFGVYYSFGLYRPHHLSDWEEFKRILSASSVGVMVAATGAFWTHSPLSRKWFAFTWAVVLALELASRAGWRAYADRQRGRGRLAMRTLVVGDGIEAARVADMLRGPGTGYSPVGHVTVDSVGAGVLAGLPVVGRLEDLEAAILDHEADCVFVASSAVGQHCMPAINRAARRTDCELRLTTNLPEMLTAPLAIQPVAGSMALAVRGVQLSGGQYFAKRAFDIAFTTLLLIVVSPLMAMSALAVRLTSRGPILFRQPRVTRGGRIFTMLKFRSMREDAETALEDQGIDRCVAFFKLGATDPRVTTVGRFLRRWSIDELPQLFNVLRGDMSLVGPRPLPAEQVVASPALLGPRHEVNAGVSGWWQIRGRSDLTPETAVALDLYYIENWSLALDLFILIKTVGAIVARRGAY